MIYLVDKITVAGTVCAATDHSRFWENTSIQIFAVFLDLGQSDGSVGWTLILVGFKNTTQICNLSTSYHSFAIFFSPFT